MGVVGLKKPNNHKFYQLIKNVHPVPDKINTLSSFLNQRAFNIKVRKFNFKIY